MGFQNLNAQQDFELWTDINLKKDFNENLELQLTVANRMDENATMREETFADIGLEYNLKWFSTAVKYRYINEYDPDISFVIAHRFSWQFSMEYDYNSFELSMRNRFQTQYYNLHEEDSELPESHYRNRIKLEYDINEFPVDPYGYFEFYYRLNKYAKREIEKNRVSVGMEYKFKNHHEISAGYIFLYKGLSPQSDKNHVLSLEYTLSL